MANDGKPANGPSTLVGGMVGAAGGYTDGDTITTGDQRRFWGVNTLLKAQIHDLVENPTIGLMGIPYDGANSRTPGTRFGPRGVRTAGTRMSGYSAEFDTMPHSKHRMADFGDVILSPFSIADAHQSIENAATRLFEAGILPVCVGGDHSVTLPLLRAAAKKHGPLAVVHFDAHCDTSDTAFGQPYHYGSIFRRATEEGIIDPAKVIQIGQRKFYHPGELSFAREHFEVITSRDLKLMGPGLRDVLKQRVARLAGAKVYVSFDIDFIDHAYAPGVGSSEPFGPTSFEAIEALRALSDIAGDIVGFDLVEICPPHDVRDQTSYLGAQILFDFVSMLPPTV